MNIDIRLSLEFFDHPKTKKLRKRLGIEGVMALLKLWAWTAGNRPGGILTGLDAEAVELAADWDGEEGAFVAELLALRLLDEDDSVFSIHDWEEHQAYASKSEERSSKARKAAEARWSKAQEMPEKSASNAHSMLGNATSIQEHAVSNAPETIVVGESTPTGQQCEEQAVDGHGVPSCPHKRIVALYHEFLPELPGVKVWEGTRQQNLQARWRERWKAGKYRTQDEGIAYWGKLFRHVSENCDWLMGRVQGRKGDKPFRASLDWIVNASNFAKLIEGRYDNREVA